MRVVVSRTLQKEEEKESHAPSGNDSANYGANHTSGDCGAGSLQATRVSFLTAREGAAIFASGRNKDLVVIRTSFPNDDQVSESQSSKAALPKTLDHLAERVHIGPALKSQIQSTSSVKVDTNTWLVAAVDSYGAGKVCKVSIDSRIEALDFSLTPCHEETENQQESGSNKRRAVSTQELKIESSQSCMVPGWAGVSFPSTGEHVTLVSSYSRQTRVVDVMTGQVKSEFFHALPPTAVSHVDSNTFVVAEWGSLSLWDVRAGGKAVQFPNRVTADRAPIYGLDVNENAVAFVGESKTATILDAKTWRLRQSWKVPIKFDGVGIKMNEKACFIAGLDHELVDQKLNQKVGQAKEKQSKRGNFQTPQSVPIGSMLHQNHRTFRSESVWAGFDIDKSSSLPSVPFVGMGNNGVVYAGFYIDEM